MYGYTSPICAKGRIHSRIQSLLTYFCSHCDIEKLQPKYSYFNHNNQKLANVPVLRHIIIEHSGTEKSPKEILLISVAENLI